MAAAATPATAPADTNTNHWTAAKFPRAQIRLFAVGVVSSKANVRACRIEQILMLVVLVVRVGTVAMQGDGVCHSHIKLS